MNSTLRFATNQFPLSFLSFRYSSFNYGIKRTLTEPNILRGHIRMKLLKDLNDIVGRRIHQNKGANVMENDWDILIILDACRYDTFEEINYFDGSLSQIYSIAPETSRFLKRTFHNQQFHDTVYVSGNPKIPAEIPDQTFHKVIPVWQKEWDDEVDSVQPDSVTKYAKSALDDFPNKRIIIHYMQPHMPLIGDEGHQFMFDNELCNGQSREWLKISWALRYGLIDISDRELYRLYEENLRVALESIENLITDIDGKIVVTSDHGELLGDRVGVIPMKGYMHPTPLHVEPLLKVPWFEISHSTRREIISEPPKSSIEVDSDKVESRLKSLGYID